MKPLPFPLRVAAGLAATTAERVRDLPGQLTGLPVTVASQLLQTSMRVQQQVTELAIKGDDVLSTFRPVEETPSWATFDEDVDDLAPGGPFEDGRSPIGATVSDPAALWTPPDRNGHRHGEPPADTAATEAEDTGSDPWAEEGRALAMDHPVGEFDSDTDLAEAESELGTEPATDAEPTRPRPAGIANYDDLTLPQLRARLRRLSLEQLEELLAYERDNANRASFVGMLARRIGNVHRPGDQGADEDPTDR